MMIDEGKHRLGYSYQLVDSYFTPVILPYVTILITSKMSNDTSTKLVFVQMIIHHFTISLTFEKALVIVMIIRLYSAYYRSLSVFTG